jgi:hypothetical protein
MPDENLIYFSRVKDRTAEEILATAGCDDDGRLGQYLRVAAQVRSDQELARALAQASDDSGKVARRIIWLTVGLVLVGLLQVAATIFAALIERRLS